MFSFHADGATMATDPWLCIYDGLGNGNCGLVQLKGQFKWAEAGIPEARAKVMASPFAEPAEQAGDEASWKNLPARRSWSSLERLTVSARLRPKQADNI